MKIAPDKSDPLNNIPRSKNEIQNNTLQLLQNTKRLTLSSDNLYIGSNRKQNQ